jgi:7-cyano-7-deazaguanine synthase in queuosine biosynthesis
MRTKNIIVKVNSSDNFHYNGIEQDNILEIQLDQTDVNKMVKANLFRDLQNHNLVPDNKIYDLINFALAVYTIDQVVSRQINGFQGWSRYLIVNFPVNDLELWQTVKDDFSTYLSFLSGDKWEFTFRQNEVIRSFELPEIRNPENFTKVSLFSGGLDSFIGAIDLLSNQEKPFFVSHYKASESKVQNNLIDKIKTKFGEDNFKSQRFWVQPNQKNQISEKENTSRARSFLFITLGISVANCLNEQIELYLPENGLISLNVPLTRSRIGSHSTRTTHPFFVKGLNTIFEKMGIGNRIVNPYRFKTKGEMILQCENREFLDRTILDTISCSHPENSRFQGREPGLNCGYCVPCIIRQSAEYKAGDIFTSYAIGDVRQVNPSQKSKSGSDYRAFKIGLEKLGNINNRHSIALQVIRSGPIPFEDLDELNEYISVYERGMEEVKQFLNRE